MYTAHDVPDLAGALASGLPAAGRFGHVMHATRPPVADIEFEMDCLRVSRWSLV